MIAVIIASPVAWYFMHSWLQDFAYRMNISWWIFVIGRIIGIVNCIANSKLPGNKSSNRKSCKEFENGMIRKVKIV